jgi:hypothetical protein
MFYLTVLCCSEFVVPLVIVDLSYVMNYYNHQVVVLNPQTGRRTVLITDVFYVFMYLFIYLFIYSHLRNGVVNITVP